jgi:hypothetical protein
MTYAARRDDVTAAVPAAVLYLKGDGSLRFFDVEGGVTARFPDASP